MLFSALGARTWKECPRRIVGITFNLLRIVFKNFGHLATSVFKRNI